AIYVLNCSVSTTEPLPAIVQELHPALLQLGRQIESLLENCNALPAICAHRWCRVSSRLEP
ncbi:hypothetical protein, partial [Acinetobacter sp. NS4_7]